MIKEIRITAVADTAEEIYMDFSRKISINKGAIILFSYNFLQYLFQIAPYSEIDVDLSDIAYSHDEECKKTVIVLKSGMRLTFTRARISRYLYVLKCLEFYGKGQKYSYDCPETYNELDDACKITLDTYK